MVLGELLNMEKLVTNWIESRRYDIESDEYEKRSWAVDKIYNLACTDAETLLNVVINILEKDDSETVVGALGSGVFEDLLVENGDKIIDSFVLLALKNKSFMRCIHYTFIDENDVSASVYSKFNMLKKNG